MWQKLMVLVACAGSCIAPAQAKDQCVIVLHGLARTASSMAHLADVLSAEGYTVVNPGYPSTQAPIEELAGTTVGEALMQCPAQAQVHFVAHSLGAILVRQYLQNQTIERLGRVVMLGPPNSGSELVDRLSRAPGFELLTGDAGGQLGTGAGSVPNALPAADFELGVIAGTHSLLPPLSLLLPGEDDGLVTVDSTRLEGMRDHISLPATHLFMVQNREVLKQVLYFLRHGRFDRSNYSN